jgi:hypothetical protein
MGREFAPTPNPCSLTPVPFPNPLIHVDFGIEILALEEVNELSNFPPQYSRDS